MGADPVACAALAAGADVKAFFVRKERKAHGLQRWVEGPPLEPGERCLVVEDVVTTGGSTVTAIERVREEGLEVVGVVSVLDRLAGGGEAIEAAAGAPYTRAGHDRRRLSGAPRPGLLAAQAARRRLERLLPRRACHQPDDLAVAHAAHVMELERDIDAARAAAGRRTQRR